MHFHGRNGALAALVVTSLALLVPSSALAGHDLGIYKSEAHLDLSSDDATTTVSCLAGDHAIDGMWRIDHADQDDYVKPLDLIAGAVDVLAAYPSSDDTYTFSFSKNAIGRAQLKVWVTCLADKTQGGSHTHLLSSAFVKSNGTTPATTFANFETDSKTATGTGNTTTPVITAFDTSNTTGAINRNCPANTILVSPGFSSDTYKDNLAATTDSSPGMMRLFESNSTNSPLSSPPVTNRNWVWKFENSALPLNYTAVVRTYWRCLKLRVPGGPDKHKLVVQRRNATYKPPAAKVSEARLNCGDHYKGMLAGFAIPSGDANDRPSALDANGLFDASTVTLHTPFNDVFYLGMDPRIKQRAYRFVNRGPVGSHPIALSVLCLNDRTT